VIIAIGRREVKVDFAERDSDGKRSIEIASGTAAVVFCLNIEALERIKLEENLNCRGQSHLRRFSELVW
jgi:hypothetical protein